MEAPDKIYLVITTRVIDEWRKEPSRYGHNIEYTRTDAFVEKACNKLKQLMHDQHLFEGRLHQDAIIENLVGDFRNYMKGE